MARLEDHWIGLIATQGLFGVLAAILWLLTSRGSASVELIVTINILGAFVQVVDSPARQAFVSRLVPPDDLASAVGLNGVVMNSTRVIGPALASVLIVTVCTTPASPSTPCPTSQSWPLSSPSVPYQPPATRLAAALTAASGPRTALLVAAAACIIAATLGARVHTPPNPDAALADLPIQAS
jgi:hypothetical protein